MIKIKILITSTTSSEKNAEKPRRLSPRPASPLMSPSVKPLGLVLRILSMRSTWSASIESLSMLREMPEAKFDIELRVPLEKNILNQTFYIQVFFRVENL